MEIVQFILAMIAPYAPIVAFLAGFLTEDLLLFLAFVAGSGNFSIITACIFGLLGIIAHDVFIAWCASSSIAGTVSRVS